MGKENDIQSPAEEAPEDQPQSPERQSFLELTRSLAGLPLDEAAAALETSAAVASISLRAGIEFLRAAPTAAQVVQPSDLRSWGEMGRRLAMGDYEAAVVFFADGVERLETIPQSQHAAVFALCTRQMSLSTAVGKETLRTLPSVFTSINDPASLIQSSKWLLRSHVVQQNTVRSFYASVDVSRALQEFNDPTVTTQSTATRRRICLARWRYRSRRLGPPSRAQSPT